jgi:hypothetical protein
MSLVADCKAEVRSHFALLLTLGLVLEAAFVAAPLLKPVLL